MFLQGGLFPKCPIFLFLPLRRHRFPFIYSQSAAVCVLRGYNIRQGQPCSTLAPQMAMVGPRAPADASLVFLLLVLLRRIAASTPGPSCRWVVVSDKHPSPDHAGFMRYGSTLPHGADRRPLCAYATPHATVFFPLMPSLQSGVFRPICPIEAGDVFLLTTAVSVAILPL